MSSSFPTEASKLWPLCKITDEGPIASSSRPTPVKRESSNGDLRKMLAAAKARSPKKNGFRPKPVKASRPKTAAEILTKSTTLVKYKKSSSVHRRTSSSPEPQPSSSLVSKKSMNVTRPTTSTEILAGSTTLAKMKIKTSSSVHHRLSSSPEPPALSSSPGTSPVRRSPTPPVIAKAKPAVTDPLDGLRLCSTKTCTRVFNYIGFRTCDKCRAQSKRKNERRKERDNATRERLARIKLSWDARPKGERFEGYMRQLRNNGILSARDANVLSMKRKAGLEDELEAASPLKKSKSDEYQNAEELYAAVRRYFGSGSKAPRFKGYFCVVGSSERGGETRVQVEAQNLLDSTGILTRSGETIVCSIGGAGAPTHFVTYQCACTPRCGGNITVEIQGVEGKFTVGDKFTVDISH